MVDREPLPPLQLEIASPRADFILTLTTPDRWKSRRATAVLFAVRDGEREQLWTRQLPHDLGPRFALVGANGRVLLLDERINVASGRAITVLDPTGSVIVCHPHADIVELVGQSGREVLAAARHGVWISAPPILDAAGQSATVAVAGKQLVIRLSDGSVAVKAR